MADAEVEHSQPKGLWVPQLFYDVIGRLVPGAALLGTLAISVSWSQDTLESVQRWLHTSSDSYPPVTLVVFVGFLLSYVLAVVLAGIWSLMLWLLLLIRPKNALTVYLFPKSLIRSKAEVVDSEKNFSRKYDFIKREDPAAGNRITKLSAEKHMSKVLILGIVLSLAIDLWKIKTSADSSRWWLATILITALLGSIGALHHLSGVQRGAMDNYCALLRYAEKMPKAWREENGKKDPIER